MDDLAAVSGLIISRVERNFGEALSGADEYNRRVFYRLGLGISVLVCMVTSLASEGFPFRQERVLFADDFRDGLSVWTSELEKPGLIKTSHGVLTIDVPAGCTLWFRPELEGAVMIQYEARMVQAGGPNDRVSDLNAFWMATDARSPDDLFATRRSGKFSDYNQLHAYYVGQGGNANTTTRLRRYIGDVVDRPLLPQHDLHGADVLLRPNVWQTVHLVALGKRIQYYRDARLVFDFVDSAPYTRGHFGFRTTASHVELRHFRVFRITNSRPQTP